MSKKVKKATVETNVDLEATTSTAPTENVTENEKAPQVTTIEEEKETASQIAKTKRTTTKKATKATKTTKASKTTKIESVPEVAPIDEHVFIQFSGDELHVSEITQKVYDAWVDENHPKSSITSLHVYIKPEEHAAYYVINETETGKVEL